MPLADLLIRLEPLPVSDWEGAVAGRVHDPLWFLARQWQLGEFQGENASTPVVAHLTVRSRPLRYAVDETLADAVATMPAEALIESEAEDWWTLGRRIRVGRSTVAALHALARELPDDPALRLQDPPPPYESSAGAWDGRALWRRRQELGIEDEHFDRRPPREPESLWQPSTLVYEREGLFTADGVALDLRRHRGGRVDWYSVDGRVDEATGAVRVDHRSVVPTRVVYPGMARRGLWEIEDTDTDIGAEAPDSSHTATAIMTDLFFSHRDEWFEVPVGGDAGSIVTIDRIRVVDDFGLVYDSATRTGAAPRWVGLQPPGATEPRPDGGDAWTLYHTAGLESADLVLWQVAELPLTGEPIERVQFGIDDESNLLWAVERRLDGRDVPRAAPETGEVAEEPEPRNPGRPDGDFLDARAYTYVPARGAEPHWIPYTLDAAGGAWEFVQRRLADYGVDPAALMPAAAADVLSAGDATHRIAAAAVPTAGIELERRWQLARDSVGNPVLWIQRQRRPMASPPARRLRFDLAEPTNAGA